MAQVLLKDAIARDPSLQSAGIEADSAGTMGDGDSATREAIEVMDKYSLDLTSHQSKALNSRLIDWADLVLVMETEHKQRVATHIIGAEKEIYMLSEYVWEEGDVADPYGCGVEAYHKCAARLQYLINKLVEKLKS